MSTPMVPSRSTEPRASLDALERPAVVELVSFSGGHSFGMIADFAADMERFGRVPILQWKRDDRGIISGLAIMERVA
jgi:hypothetical protein